MSGFLTMPSLGLLAYVKPQTPCPWRPLAVDTTDGSSVLPLRQEAAEIVRERAEPAEEILHGRVEKCL